MPFFKTKLLAIVMPTRSEASATGTRYKQPEHQTAETTDQLPPIAPHSKLGGMGGMGMRM